MDTKKIIFRIPKGWKRSRPFTLKYFFKKFHRVECNIYQIPYENQSLRIFGIKHGIYPGRYIEVLIDNKDIVINYNNITILRKHIEPNVLIRVEYTARDYLKQIVLILPDNYIFTFKYATTKKTNKLLIPKSNSKLKNNRHIVWKIMF